MLYNTEWDFLNLKNEPLEKLKREHEQTQIVPYIFLDLTFYFNSFLTFCKKTSFLIYHRTNKGTSRSHSIPDVPCLFNSQLLKNWSNNSVLKKSMSDKSGNRGDYGNGPLLSI